VSIPNIILVDPLIPHTGYESQELVGTPSLDLVHPDEYRDVKSLHYTTISQDKAAVLAYLRLKHKDPYKGYVLCAIVRNATFLPLLSLTISSSHEQSHGMSSSVAFPSPLWAQKPCTMPQLPKRLL